VLSANLKPQKSFYKQEHCAVYISLYTVSRKRVHSFFLHNFNKCRQFRNFWL